MANHPALDFAIETANENGYTANPARLLDKHFPESYPCYEITPGLVVYEDEPNTVVSVQWKPGRFVTA